MTRAIRGRGAAVVAMALVIAGAAAVTSQARAGAAARPGGGSGAAAWAQHQARPGGRGGAAARAGAQQPPVWPPPEDTDWMWELSVPLNLNNPKLMGTGVTAYNGDTPPGDNPRLYDIDGIINPASTVADLHSHGDHAICYIEVGTAGNYYSTGQEGIPVTYYKQLKNAGDLGKKISGYPEYFININDPKAVSIIEAMIDQQCYKKGFDGVETDLDETFGHNEGTTGFTITEQDEVNYLTTLATYMHGLGLAWIAKNLDDTQNSSFVDAMAPLAQGIISEQCNQYNTCSYLSPFLTAGKWIGNAEYSLTQSQFCPKDNGKDMNGVLFNVNLAGGRQPCR